MLRTFKSTAILLDQVASIYKNHMYDVANKYLVLAYIIIVRFQMPALLWLASDTNVGSQMVQTDGTGRHLSVNSGLFSARMPNLGAHFVPQEKLFPLRFPLVLDMFLHYFKPT